MSAALPRDPTGVAVTDGRDKLSLVFYSITMKIIYKFSFEQLNLHVIDNTKVSEYSRISNLLQPIVHGFKFITITMK